MIALINQRKESCANHKSEYEKHVNAIKKIHSIFYLERSYQYDLRNKRKLLVIKAQISRGIIKFLLIKNTNKMKYQTIAKSVLLSD